MSRVPQPEMSDSVIRKATASDISVISRLLGELLTAVGGAEGVDLGMAFKTCEKLLHEDSLRVLVAEVDGEPAGFISLSIRQTILHPGPSGLIDELVVAKSYRGRGVGRELVLAAVTECKRLGCCELEVNTEETNTEARKLYRTCGFEERGVLLELDL